MVTINLTLIATIWVLVIDIAQFVEELKHIFWKWVFKGNEHNYKPFRIKPFDCSLCLTFWTGLVYLIYTHTFSLKYLAVLLFIATCTPLIADGIRLIQDAFSKIINGLYDLLKL